MKNEKYALLFDLGLAFNSLIDLDALLPRIMAETKEALQAESCALLFLDETTQELFFPGASWRSCPDRSPWPSIMRGSTDSFGNPKRS